MLLNLNLSQLKKRWAHIITSTLSRISQETEEFQSVSPPHPKDKPPYTQAHLHGTRWGETVLPKKQCLAELSPHLCTDVEET